MISGFVFAQPPAWWDEAQCRDVENPATATYFAPDPGPAVESCRSCSVQGDCLTAGLDELHGVWGGATPRDRRRIRAMIASDPNLSPIEALRRLES